jgi:uncharacterized protein
LSLRAGKDDTTAGRSAPVFFLMVVALAAPVWLAGGALGVIGSLRVPASDLILAFTPMAAALALTGWREGWARAAALLARAFDIRSVRPGRPLAAAVLLPPLIYLVSWGLMQQLGPDAPIATPNGLRLLLLFGLFLILAAGEEIGWMGYAFGPLQRRWGPLGASVLLAMPWWLGHLPSMRAIGATSADMAWWLLGAFGLRIIMTWLYNRTGASLFAVVLFHALLNLSRIAIIPAVGSHYVSAYQAVSYVLVAVIAAGLLGFTRGRLGAASEARRLDV